MTTPSRPDIVQANVRVYDGLADSFRAGRDSYLPVMREAMGSYLRFLKERGAQHILDIGSGAGIHAQICSEAGFSMTCIDAAANMLKIVQDNVPTARCIVSDFWTFEPEEKFDGVVLASFIHLFPKEDLSRVIARVNSWLKPGAVGWIATATGQANDGEWLEKEENHGKAKRWRVVYAEDELLARLTGCGLEVLDLVRAPDGIHSTKMWLDVVAAFPGNSA